MARPMGAAQTFGQAARHGDGGGETLRVHVLDTGRIQHIDAGAGQQPRILRVVGGIAGEVLARTELGRIDEQAGHHAPAAAPGGTHQRQVAVMDRPHGGHQRHGFAGAAPLGDPALQLGRGGEHGEGPVGEYTRFDHRHSRGCAGCRDVLYYRRYCRYDFALATAKQCSGPGKSRARTSRE